MKLKNKSDCTIKCESGIVLPNEVGEFTAEEAKKLKNYLTAPVAPKKTVKKQVKKDG